MKQHAIILYDGDCIFCRKSVHMIINHDPRRYFYFAALNGKTGAKLKAKYHVPKNLNSLILIENETFYTASTAVLRISRKLTGIYRLGMVFLIIPKPLRDAVYRFVSERRHRFSRNSSCALPSTEELKRFFD